MAHCLSSWIHHRTAAPGGGQFAARCHHPGDHQRQREIARAPRRAEQLRQPQCPGDHCGRARLGAIAGVAHRRAQRSLYATVAGYVTTSAAGLLVLAAAAMYDVERRAPAGNIKSFVVGRHHRHHRRLRRSLPHDRSRPPGCAAGPARPAGRPGATSSARRLRRHGPPGRRLASRWREPVKRAAVLLLLPLAACSTPTPAAAPPNPPSQPPVTASALSRPSSAAPPELPSSSLPVAPSPTRTAAAGRTATAAPVPPPVTSSGALCHPRAVPGGVLPDAACTPGTANPDVTQATIGSTICRSGYTRHHPPAGVLHQCAQAPADRRLRLSRHRPARLRGGSPDRAGTGRRAQRSAQPLAGAGALAEPEGQGRERVAPAGLRRLADAGRGATADRHGLDDRRPLSPSRLRPATKMTTWPRDQATIAYGAGGDGPFWSGPLRRAGPAVRFGGPRRCSPRQPRWPPPS